MEPPPGLCVALVTATETLILKLNPLFPQVKAEVNRARGDARVATEKVALELKRYMKRAEEEAEVGGAGSGPGRILRLGLDLRLTHKNSQGQERRFRPNLYAKQSSHEKYALKIETGVYLLLASAKGRPRLLPLFAIAAIGLMPRVRSTVPALSPHWKVSGG